MYKKQKKGSTPVISESGKGDLGPKKKTMSVILTDFDRLVKFTDNFFYFDRFSVKINIFGQNFLVF